MFQSVLHEVEVERVGKFNNLKFELGHCSGFKHAQLGCREYSIDSGCSPSVFFQFMDLLDERSLEELRQRMFPKSISAKCQLV